MPAMRMKDDRSFGLWLIFSVLTCGIYSLYTIYSIAKDVNHMCNGDGEMTQGLFIYIVLNLITCGIYNIYWMYKIGNRLYNNQTKYDAIITDTGESYLIWVIMGSVCNIISIFCPAESFLYYIFSIVGSLGLFMSMYMLFKNVNYLARGYNSKIEY